MPNTIFGYQRGIKNIDKIASAEFNLLISPWVSVKNVKKMEKKLGIPYLHYSTLPIGAFETSKFLREVGKFAGVDEKKVEDVIMFKVAYADTHAGNVEFATPDTTEEVTSDGGSKSVTIHTSPSWTASSNVDWITLGATSGTGVENTLSYTVAANSTGSARTGIITVTSNGSSCKVIVNQQ